MTNTDEDTTSNEDTNLTTGRKCLHKGCNHDTDGSRSHTNTATSEISEGTSHKETSNDSTDGVGSVDRSDDIGTRVVVVGNPVLRVLESVEDGSIITIEHHA